MGIEPNSVIGWARIITIFFCFAWAAWLDHLERRVPNQHWLTWSQPAAFLMLMELIIAQADISLYMFAAGLFALASISVIGRPTIRDIMQGNKLDVLVSIWYVVGIIGLLLGIPKYGIVEPADLLLGNIDGLTLLWWQFVVVIFVLIIIDLGWRFRLIHGGADAKALMLVALTLPHWDTVPVLYEIQTDTALGLPPAISILMWGGLAFLLIPIFTTVENIVKGNIKSANEIIRMFHTVRIPLDEVMTRHVWLLTTVIESADGEKSVTHNLKAPRKTPSDEQLQKQVDELKSMDVESVWVSRKFPLLVFLWPAIIPMIIWGDFMGLVAILIA